MSSLFLKSIHHKFFKLTLMVLLLLGGATMTGQDVPKFGDVSYEDLQIYSYPEAPDADAVYMFDVGEMRIMDDFTLVLKRHVRVKILTEEGKEYANVHIRYWYKDKIRAIKGHTITPAGKKIKLKKVFDEEEKNWKYKVFTLPGVEVGSIIEYKFELVTEYLHYLEPWYFQNPEFTKLSQLSAVILPGFAYNVFFSNTPDVEKEEEEFLEPGRKLTRFTWKMEDLPPIKEEAYMSAPKDYMAALHFQLISYQSQYVYHKWIDSWPELVDKMREYYDPFMNEKTHPETILAAEPSEKGSKPDTVKALYDYVRENVESTSRGYIHPDDHPDQVLKDLKGTGAEKNMLLVNLLRRAGLKAYPLLISTRSSGKIFPNLPNLDQFNYVLAYLKIGGKSYVLDTYRKYCPFALLPTYDLVEQGLLIDERDGQFVDLPLPRGTNMEHSITKASIDESGTLAASSTIRYENYQGYFARDDINDSGEEEFVKKTLNDRFGEVDVDSFTIKGLEDIEGPLYLDVRFKVKDFAQVSGDLLYIGSPTFHYQKSNPFKREKRYFPVEFLHPYASSDDVTLSIPQGFRIDELPENVMRRNEDMSFAFTFTANEHNIEIQRQYLRQKSTYSVREYSDLRNYFDMMIRTDQAQMVFSNDAVLTESND